MSGIELSDPKSGDGAVEQRAVVGIDLGTSNSLVGVCQDDSVLMLGDEAGQTVIPSAVHYAQDGRVLVGNAAMHAGGRGMLLTSVKRLLGLDNDAFARACARAGYQCDTKEDIGHIVLGKRSVTAVEVSAQILQMLWTLAHKHFGHEPEGCVITVPAYFGEKQRQAVRLAARLQGINVLRLLDEPTAAAIAYGLDHEKSRHVLVYDLGGGTFDVSVIRLHQGVFEVLAIGGDDALGGDDFDSLIVEWMRKSLSGDVDDIPIPALRRKARQIKEVLSSMSVVQVDLSDFGIDETLSLDIDELEELIAPLIDKTISLTAAAVRDSGLRAEQLDKIILSGGATRVPLVERKLCQVYDQEILASIDPEQVVARGASLHAAQLVGNLSNRHLLLGVLPLSLGIETMGGIVEVILPRNSTLPARQVNHFTTHQNNQTGMIFHIVQGEREMSRDCRSLAHFELKGLPPAPAGFLRIELIFEVDADGLLTAYAREPNSGAEVNVEVRPSSGLNESKVEKMLLDSYSNAEEDHRARLLGEQGLKAQDSLAAVERLAARIGSLPKKLQSEVDRRSQALRESLQSDDYELILTSLAQLNEISEQLVQQIFDEKFVDGDAAG